MVCYSGSAIEERNDKCGGEDVIFIKYVRRFNIISRNHERFKLKGILFGARKRNGTKPKIGEKRPERTWGRGWRGWGRV